MSRSIAAITIVLVSASTVVWRAHAQPARQSVEAYVAAHQRAIVGELVDLLSIPNVAADRKNARRNAEFIRQMLGRRGLRAELLETAGNPLVYGELKVTGATRTLLVYSHYDGQPVDDGRWSPPTPFKPVLRDGRLEEGAKEIAGLGSLDEFQPHWRLYARSASDDKSPIVALCAALDALAAAGRTPSHNVRVLLDGEEEVGSPSLPPVIPGYRDRLSADLLVILDGPMHPTGRPTMVFGASGLLWVELTVFGARSGLHSGHFGNWAPNPATRLARLLASMKDDDGRVLVEGFYDGVAPAPPAERAILDAVPDDPAVLQKRFGIAAPERAGLSLQDAIQLPSLNVRGLASDSVGPASRDVIPERAVAAIDIRLTVETPLQDMLEKIRAHVVRQGFHVTAEDPDDETRARYPRIVKLTWSERYRAYRTSPFGPEAKRVTAALAQAAGEEPVRIRTFGSGLPLTSLINLMGYPAISVCTVNYDNNQHGDNENIRLGHFFQAIVTAAAILTM